MDETSDRAYGWERNLQENEGGLVVYWCKDRIFHVYVFDSDGKSNAYYKHLGNFESRQAEDKKLLDLFEKSRKTVARVEEGRDLMDNNVLHLIFDGYKEFMEKKYMRSPGP